MSNLSGSNEFASCQSASFRCRLPPAFNLCHVGLPSHYFDSPELESVAVPTLVKTLVEHSEKLKSMKMTQ